MPVDSFIIHNNKLQLMDSPWVNLSQFSPHLVRSCGCTAPTFKPVDVIVIFSMICLCHGWKPAKQNRIWYILEKNFLYSWKNGWVVPATLLESSTLLTCSFRIFPSMPCNMRNRFHHTVAHSGSAFYPRSFSHLRWYKCDWCK